MEQEKQDQVIQDFINDMNRLQVVNCKEYQETNKILLSDWNDMIKLLLDRDFIITNTYMVRLTPAGNTFTENRYKEYIKKEREEKELQRKKNESNERKFEERFNLEMIQLKRQVKVFWIGFFISVIALIFAVASYFKPSKASIQTKYVGVDSKGRTIQLQDKH